MTSPEETQPLRGADPFDHEEHPMNDDTVSPTDTPAAAYETDVPPTQPATRPRTRTAPLVLGLVYLMAFLVWGAVELGWLAAADLDIVIPLAFTTAGGAGLVLLALGSRRTASTDTI